MLDNWRQLSALLDKDAPLKMAGLLGLMLVGGLFETIGLGLLLPFLQLLINPARLPTLPYVGPYLAPYADQLGSSFLMFACLGMLGFYIVKNMYLALLVWINYRFTFQSEAKLEHRLLTSYLRAPYQHIARRNSAELIRTVSVSARSVCNGTLSAYLNIAMESFLILSAVSVFIFVDPVGALVVACLMGLLVLALYLPLRRFQTERGSESQVCFANLIKWIQQSIGILKEARVVGREDYFLERFNAVANRSARLFTQLLTVQHLPRFISEVVVLSCFLGYIMLVFSRQQGIEHALPALAVFAAASLRLLPSVNRIVTSLGSIRQGKKALDLASQDIGTCAPQALPVSPQEFSYFHDKLVLEDVSYGYPGTSSKAIEGIGMTVKQGMVVALVGPSGAGKSTLADLLLGLLPPQSGDIRIDGKPVRLGSPAWHASLGYVPQQIYLLDDTITRNVAFGLRDEDINPESVRRAILLAGLEDVIRDLPEGLETVVGERGASLSGGQRQRIGIARALYHRPSLLVFDEITSALDSETEREIVDAIQSLRGEATVIVIAHRLSTISHSDHIVVLDQGRIVDQGGYEWLLQNCPLFKRLAESYAVPLAKSNA